MLEVGVLFQPNSRINMEVRIHTIGPAGATLMTVADDDTADEVQPDNFGHTILGFFHRYGDYGSASVFK